MNILKRIFCSFFFLSHAEKPVRFLIWQPEDYSYDIYEAQCTRCGRRRIYNKLDHIDPTSGMSIKQWESGREKTWNEESIPKSEMPYEHIKKGTI